MRYASVFALGLLLCPFASPQAANSNGSGVSPSVNTAIPDSELHPAAARSPQPPSYANYTIMLVSPVTNGGGVVLMHTPKNSIEYVDLRQIQAALNNGYVPVRSAEIIDAINYLHAENDRLTAENARLKGSPATPAPVVVIAPQPQPDAPSQAQIEAEQRAQAAARRQQIIQSFIMMQNANRPQTQDLNVRVTDCTRYPALCAGR